MRPDKTKIILLLLAAIISVFFAFSDSNTPKNFQTFRDFSYEVRRQTPTLPGEWQNSGALWKNPNIGYSLDDTLWIRVQLPNPGKDYRKVFLDPIEREIERMELSLQYPNELIVHHIGTMQPSRSDTKGSQFYSYPARGFLLNLPPGVTTATLALSGRGIIRGDFYIVDIIKGFGNLSLDFGVHFAFLVLTVLTAIVAVIAAVRLRSRPFLFLGATLLLLLLATTSYKGFLRLLLPGISLRWVCLTNPALILACFVGANAAADALKLRNTPATLVKPFQVLGYIPLLCLPFLFIDRTYVTASYLSDALITFGGTVILAISFVVYLRHKEVGTRILTIAAPFSIGVITMMLWRHSIIADSFFSYYALSLGSATAAGFIFVILMRAFIEDAVSRRALERDCEHLTEEVLEKQRLVRFLHHDLANSLSAIGVLSRSIKPNSSDPVSVNQLQMLRRAADGVLATTALVRTLDAAKSGKMTPRIAPVALGKLLQDTLGDLEPFLKEKSLSASCEFETVELESTASVLGDEQLLRYSVFSNLLSNAIKYSYRGGQIRIKVRKDKEGIAVDVIDNGTGVSKELLPILLSPIGSKSRKGTSCESGTGFGLSIANSFVRDMGGELKITSTRKDESSLEHGTVVTAILRPA